jgi:NSS family neurotransmitter:Na+ symporter
MLNSVFAVMFFLALSFAALSSLISLIELTTRVFIDYGITRKKAVWLVVSAGFMLGLPSATNLDFFTNQDWVWGVGLILSGAFIAFAVNKFGVDKFRNEIINASASDLKIGKWYNIFMKYLIPFQAIILLVWWLASSVTWDPQWWNPFHAENAGTCLVQWGIFLTVFYLFNKKIVMQKWFE